MSDREVISLDVDVTKKVTFYRKKDGSLWALYFTPKGIQVELPVSLIGLGDLLGSRVTLAGLGANLYEPKDLNRLITDLVPTGRVIYQDDMEGLLKWSTGGSAGGSVSKITVMPVFNGSAALDLTTGATAGYYVTCTKRFSLPYNRRVGMAGWWYSANDRIGSIRMEMDLRDGKTEWGPEIGYYVTEKYWTYKNAAGADVKIQGSDMDLFYGAQSGFWYAKAVFDFASEKYGKLYVNGKVFDLSNFDLYKMAEAVTEECLLVSFAVTTRTNASATGNLDDVVLTEAEP